MLKIKYFIGIILLSVQANVFADCVILLHGLTRSADSMKKMEVRLIAAGYHTVNLDYPSTKFNIEQLTEKTIEPAIKKCPKGQKVHFVTHSLGGILIRNYLNKKAIKKLHRVVMLGPPNQGSEVVDKLKNIPGFYFINGEAGLQLGTDSKSIPMQLGEANFELGIIAGNWSINFILSTLIPGNDDGKVSVERSKLKGMSDHIIMPVTHPFMMKNEKVISQVITFLESGQFTYNRQ